MSRHPSPSSTPGTRKATGKDPGISNRESAREESAERAAHPPADGNEPPAENAAGHRGEPPAGGHDELQTSRKAGSRSTAQKETGSRYPDRAMPPSKKVPGAFGEEPDAPPDRKESK